ncbi:LPD7 domain-containing protein [Paraburkholderia tropica]|uniref:LPD7 domain-containing protein n=1 Tax=Paraburkholderia tropica TaxID=92647 RepID=UPI002AB7E58F|nr:LPD7 domain-containing protein [Paraburkholderia tropica]
MNEIEFPGDRVDYRERDAANAGDASAIRARAAAPANEADGNALPGKPESSVDEATAGRLRKVRENDRKRAEGLLRGTGGHAAPDSQTDEAVKPATGTGIPLNGRERGAGNSIRPKPVFEKTGYEVPKSVSKQYVAHEGKFLDRKSETVHFEDTGRTLATASEDRGVISHMVEVARAKNWDELQLKGTEEFRRQAWIAAELAGVPTRGFKPKEQDRAMLTAAREAMRIGAGEKSADAGADARTNTVETAAGQKQDVAGPDNPVKDPAQGAMTGPVAAASGTAPTPRQATSQPGAEATSQAQSPSPSLERASAGVTAGVLVAHGPARFNHDEKQNHSYYATVRTAAGEQTVWGLDLERAIGESGVQVGQRIDLEKGGSKTVTVQQRQFDERGRELAPKTVESRRNEWLVYSPDVPGLLTRADREALAAARREGDDRQRINEARERFLSGNWQYTKDQRATLDAARERIKEQAAREVLRDEIRDLPAQQQEQLMGEFEGAVSAARAANRPLDVPMPQVSEATIEAVREQIERERQGHAQAEQRATQQTSPGRGEDALQPVEHDAPGIEIEP